MKKIRIAVGKCLESDIKYMTQCHKLIALLRPLMDVTEDEKERAIIIKDFETGYLLKMYETYRLYMVLAEIEKSGRITREQLEKCKV